MKYLLSLACLLFATISYAGGGGGGYSAPYRNAGLYDLNIDILYDIDRDGITDYADDDKDGDGIPNAQDPYPFFTGTDLYKGCPSSSNLRNVDSDHDGIDDSCDSAPFAYNPRYDDNCDGVVNATSSQDADPIANNFMNGLSISRCAHGLNPPAAGNPAVGDNPPPADPALDWDGDGLDNEHDNCIQTPNPDQADTDKDGVGDACDSSPMGSASKNFGSNADENSGSGGEPSSSCMSLGKGIATFGSALFPWGLALLFLLALRLATRRSRG